MGELVARTFKRAPAFRAWLRANGAKESDLLVRIRKAGSETEGITYAEALDEALCYGWIDGVRRRIDDDGFSIRFSPRKPTSIWSRINVAHVARLKAAGRMRKPGLAAFEARQERRTGVYSFERPPQVLPPAYQRRLRANTKAWDWFQKQAPWYRRVSTHWVVSAKKEETRERRLAQLIARSAAHSPIGLLQRKP
jgi:uncharacterized protein YdeI (YjbR/CyaY-like superfamily)